MCWKCVKTAQNVTFWTKRKATEKDGDLKFCPPVGQIEHKNVKNMDKLLSNWFDKSASNVPKLPEMSFLQPRKKSKKRIAISKLALQWVNIDRKNRKKNIKWVLKWFANSFRKSPAICTGNVPKLPKMSLFEPRERSQKKMATSKFALQ